MNKIQFTPIEFRPRPIFSYTPPQTQPKPKRVVKKKPKIPPPKIGLFNTGKQALVPPVPPKKKTLTLANVKASHYSSNGHLETNSRDRFEVIDDIEEYFVWFHDVAFGGRIHG